MNDIDSEGYPTDEALAAIENWDRRDISGCFDYIGRLWHYPERWNRDGRVITASTGGWSGNEDLIGALRENTILWAMSWWEIRRGGHYVFKVPVGDMEDASDE